MGERKPMGQRLNNAQAKALFGDISSIAKDSGEEGLAFDFTPFKDLIATLNDPGLSIAADMAFTRFNELLPEQVEKEDALREEYIPLAIAFGIDTAENNRQLDELYEKHRKAVEKALETFDKDSRAGSPEETQVKILRVSIEDLRKIQEETFTEGFAKIDECDDKIAALRNEFVEKVFEVVAEFWHPTIDRIKAYLIATSNPNQGIPFSALNSIMRLGESNGEALKSMLSGDSGKLHGLVIGPNGPEGILEIGAGMDLQDLIKEALREKCAVCPTEKKSVCQKYPAIAEVLGLEKGEADEKGTKCDCECTDGECTCDKNADAGADNEEK